MAQSSVPPPPAGTSATPGNNNPAGNNPGDNSSGQGKTAPSTDTPAVPAGAAVTLEQQREQQIRQFDPLDQSDEDKKKRDKARDEDEQRNQANQTPGSIAAGRRNAQGPVGPQVQASPQGTALLEGYTGPAVLSRSYTINQPLIPQDAKWTDTIGFDGVYDSGVIETVNPDGSLSRGNLVGGLVRWGLTGKHYFGRDQLAVDYSGNYTNYSGPGGFSGANNSLTLDYTHHFSRHVSLELSGMGVILSQSYLLENPSLSIASISTTNSPNVEVTDQGLKQYTSQGDLVWQKTARLSFSWGGSVFGISRSAPLIGMTGTQARTDVNYRLTKQTTIGTYYSYSYYLYPHQIGTSNTNTVGGIYSYSFSKTMEFRFRGGVSDIRTLGQQTVQVAPDVAVLTGSQTGIVYGATHTVTSDISAQVIKDFRRGATGTISYAHGVSPGNGIFQTSEQQTISISGTLPLTRRYSLTAIIGRDTLNAIGQILSNYEGDYGRVALTRTFDRGWTWDFSTEFRHFSLAAAASERDEVRIVSGFSWGSREGKLWPF